MIRDEFKETNKKPSIRDGYQGNSKMTKRAARKKATMGERNYYAYQAKKLQDLSKAISFSNNFSLIIFGVLYALFLVVYILLLNQEESIDTVRFIIWSGVFLLFVLWYFLWKFLFKGIMQKRVEWYTKELQRMSLESLTKIGNAYKFYGKTEEKG